MDFHQITWASAVRATTDNFVSQDRRTLVPNLEGIAACVIAQTNQAATVAKNIGITSTHGCTYMQFVLSWTLIWRMEWSQRAIECHKTVKHGYGNVNTNFRSSHQKAWCPIEVQATSRRTARGKMSTRCNLTSTLNIVIPISTAIITIGSRLWGLGTIVYSYPVLAVHAGKSRTLRLLHTHTRT